MTNKPTLLVRKPYDPAYRTPILFNKPSMAKQSFKDETNINTIMQRYERTGLLEHSSSSSPQYGDFSNVTDYQTAINAVMDAQLAFSELPARVRRRFDNDPAEFMAFLHDEANLDEARELGLAPPAPVTPPDPSPDPPEAGQDKKTAPPSAAGE